MNYNRKKCWGAVVIVFIAAVLAAGYAIGDYFVDYALKRGNETDPLAPPAACVNILDKSREMPEEPAVPTEEWRMTMPDGRNPRIILRRGFLQEHCHARGSRLFLLCLTRGSIQPDA